MSDDGARPGTIAMMADDASGSPSVVDVLSATEAPAKPSRHLPLVLLYSATIFLSSALLFLIQPMVAKMVLPRFGGVPAVWTSSMVFFQAALLAGYWYAHKSISWAGVKRQAMVHVPLLLLPFVFLPFTFRPGWIAPSEGSPIPALLGLLTISIGVPFFVVASSGPMLQRWFASTGHRWARDPYFLYAASNLGSLLGLLAYPILLEPSATLADQARTWALAYGLLVALIGACAATVWRSRPQAVSEDVAGIDRISGEPQESAQRVTRTRRLRWIALAFVPSSLMLGVTTHLSNDIAPVPMLWVMPLSLYLLTFVFAFGRRTSIRPSSMVRALPFVLLPLLLVMGLGATHPPLLLVVLHLATFFVAAMICHGALAADRPSARQLTDFYLWVSVGGVLGGLANAVVAPLIFNTVAEYPIALALAAAFRRPSGEQPRRRSRWLDIALPAGVALWILTTSAAFGSRSNLRTAAVLGVPTIALLAFASRRVRFALGVAAFLFASSASATGSPLFRERTFFGVHRVAAANGFHMLVHGNTVHGIQRWPAGRPEPLSYYHRESPVGDVFRLMGSKARRVGVVGLGTGSLACFAAPEQQWTFFEIDPAVAGLARDARYFTFLRDCPANLRIVLGDARLSLGREADERYDVMVIDAFNSDSIPVHLMTREALQLYLTRTTKSGLLAFHISNRYLDLAPVMANLARDAGLTAIGRGDSLSREQVMEGKSASIWVVMARRPADLGRLAELPGWRRLEGRSGERVWTDDYSNILGVFRWK